ncbi:MAG TPA: AAA family ATPase [Candidatus Limnocylindria bacterium]
MLACPACGHENTDDAKFCNACGAPMASAQSSRKERKFATALFADLVGSTSLNEREDPEVVQSVIGRTFDRFAQEISRYEGLLEKFMGDGLLAVFGVPRAHEDDAERAVRAALDLQDILAELNRGFAAEGKPTLQMRIGLEAGEVLVDMDRALGPRDRMLTGDAVNTAARLQSAAEPNQIVAGASVHAGTKEVIEYAELEPLTLKGKAERVPAWRALRIKARLRGERARLGMEAELTGRDEELAVLKGTFHRVQTDDRPALVTVIGPAGVGKSRLVAELERYVEGLPDLAYWRRGRCLAYANTSYSALADAVKAQCEIFDDDSADAAAAKAEAAARELFGDDSVVPQLRALVGAGESRDTSREELFEGWRRFLERLANRFPLVLVLEDIQWADDGLLDFIDHVADWAQGPIMVVATARAELFEKRPTWGGGKRNATSIYLDPLSAAEGEAMLDDLLPGPVEPSLKQHIVERSEGNPLYIEEIVRKLIDDGVLRATAASRWEVARPVADIQLPRSVQGLIAARLDGLPDDEKAVLQDAAVVGRVFWVGAIAQLTGHPVAEVRDALGRLRVKELVVPHDPSSFRDEPEFAFRHALIRDGAYDTLPKSLRADMHLGVARWAEEQAGDRAEDIAELVATHELEAIRYLDELGERRPDVERRAFDHAAAAARRTASLWQRTESTRWYREAERMADRLGLPPAERAPLLREHAFITWGTDPVIENERVARRAIEIFRTLGDDRGLGWAYSRLVLPLMQESRHDEAEQMGRLAVSTLEPLGESVELADAIHRLGWFLWRRGREPEAEPLLRQAVGMAIALNAQLILAEATQTLAVCIMSTAPTMVESQQMMERAFVLAMEAGDSQNLIRAYNNLAHARSNTAGPKATAEVLTDGLELALKSGIIGNGGWVAGTLGDMYQLLGQLERAEEYQHQSLALARRVGDEPLIGQRLTALAGILAERGQLEAATEARDEAAPLLMANRESQDAHFLPYLDGMLALARDDWPAAADRFTEAVELLRAYTTEAMPEAIAECVRALLHIGAADRAAAYRDLDAGTSSIMGDAFAANIRGLLATSDDEARREVQDALQRFERLEMRSYAARAMVDLARLRSRAGEDPFELLATARAQLLECGAVLHLAAVDQAEREARLLRQPADLLG